jgi:hypothetical protein
MTTTSTRPRENVFHLQMSEFWSGDLGLTLVTISLVVLVFVITPLREAGLQAHFVFGAIIVALMIFGAVSVQQSRLGTLLLVGFVVATAVFLTVARFRPTPLMHELGSILSTNYLAPVRSHCSGGDVPDRLDPLEPRPGWGKRVSASRNGLGFRVPGGRAISAWVL